MFLASGPTMGMALLDKDFKVLEWVKPGVYFPSWPMYAQVFFYKGKRLLAYQHVKTAPIENFQYILDISADTTTLSAFKNIGKKTAVDRIIYSVSLGNISNGNASVSMDMLTNDAGNLLSFNYSAGNGFLLQKLGDVASNTKEYDLSAFKMYPNPAADFLSLEAESLIRQVVISDLNTRTIRRISLNNYKGTIDIGGLHQGMYLISIETDKGIFTQKLMIQK
jgi:hypothetical protein